MNFQSTIHKAINEPASRVTKQTFNQTSFFDLMIARMEKNPAQMDAIRHKNIKRIAFHQFAIEAVFLNSSLLLWIIS